MTYKLLTVEKHPRQFLHVQEHNKEQTINVLLLTCDAVRVYTVMEVFIEERLKDAKAKVQVNDAANS